MELIGHFGQVGVAKVGCARNDKTECGTGNGAFLIHSEFDLQSSRRYIRYLQQPFCEHVLYIYKPSPFTTPGLSDGAAGLRGTFPGHPRPPSPLLSPFWTTQYAHNTTSMGGPFGRDLNPADLAVVVGRVSLSFHHPTVSP
ncbi:hypothetical protein GEV33_007711 [Tenebrio molitor]|uniref:Uncharacterized protein n=1 Tax=Tenebrio molitor TaxID=7067 RepID=A0A8J6HAC6_TENMO|nr:hypothetical protein GEV33_007711 [Tenebrio molitor]